MRKCNQITLLMKVLAISKNKLSNRQNKSVEMRIKHEAKKS
jgi:hypothetical protein